MTEAEAQVLRLVRDRAFVVTYLADINNPFCQLVLNMQDGAAVSDMIARLPYYASCQDSETQEPSSFDMFNRACSVFQARSEYVGSEDQLNNVALSRAKAHAQLLPDSWAQTTAQDIFIVWRHDGLPGPFQLYMRHGLRQTEAQGRPAIAAVGDSAGFEATRSRLDDMSQSLSRLLNKV